MKNKEIKRVARQQLKGQWGTAALFTLLFAAVYYFIPLILEINLSGGFNTWVNKPDNVDGPAASTFLITLVLLPLYIGYLWTFYS
ncbi:hypothetical protein AWM68_12945 [Fictibacillus phosphorivorans]|uniref:DUF485 domain-containing protein n=1 Tax=Fictibacillus phosphorivorans TaxID=1221500 RepID=A0A163PRH0_9BACL|nr:DUF975 family protein [Fictibacillus phosphorivorans]KZE64011.1 hypothetical protein AWM68_12945 [Fictibacillus phosphorivorans]